MSTPFPGMDPYLERASLWPNVHNSLIVALRDDLAPRLRPRYYVAVEERTVRLTPEDLAFTVRPDVAVAEPSSKQPATAGWRRQTLAVGAVVVELPIDFGARVLPASSGEGELRRLLVFPSTCKNSQHMVHLGYAENRSARIETNARTSANFE